MRWGAATRTAACCAALAALVLPNGAGAQGPPELPTCIKPDEETPEIYGPTDIGATVGNQRLSVAVNPEGTLSVMRWPSPSYWDQIKYLTIDRDRPDLGVRPNEGAFSGLALTLRDGSRRTVWLRDWQSHQIYLEEDSDTVVTRYRDDRLGVTMEVADVVPQHADVLMRRHFLRLSRRSPVRTAHLIAFANLNPTASRRPLLPTEDWCEEEDATDRVRFDSRGQAVVWSIEEQDGASGRQESVAVAMGANRQTSGHQIGGDSYARQKPDRSRVSAYDDAADGRLGGADSLSAAEADSAISLPISRRRPVTVTFAAATGEQEALALLDRHRRRSAVKEAQRKRRSYVRWLRRAPLPRGAPRQLTRLARRALISLRQATDERAGAQRDKAAVVASIATQSPYGQDWIRDGAFFNEVLAEIGHHDVVERHNLFYAEVQKKLAGGAPPGTPLSVCQQPTPDGNWFMTNWADGPDAGVFSWEIDEAGFGLWTLWRHYERTGDLDYLRRIYPALRRTAEFLVAFRDPVTGLTPGTACEDDNPPRPGQPTMHASGPVLLAMRSATSAAEALGEKDDAGRYRARADELAAGIDARHRTESGAWTNGFGDGGWALWPVQVEASHDHPRMRAQAEAAWRGVAPAFEAPGGPRKRGQYEVKALHGLAHHHKAVDPAGMERVKRGLTWISDVQAAWQPTGILGEAWYVRDGRVASVVAQPHVWEQALVYLASLEAYGREPYRAKRPGRLRVR